MRDGKRSTVQEAPTWPPYSDQRATRFYQQTLNLLELELPGPPRAYAHAITDTTANYY